MIENYEYLTLEDNQNYIILDEIKGSQNYIYLSNMNDPKDFLARKIIMYNNEEEMINLESDNEFKEAMNLYKMKHQNES